MSKDIAKKYENGDIELAQIAVRVHLFSYI